MLDLPLGMVKTRLRNSLSRVRPVLESRAPIRNATGAVELIAIQEG